VGDVTYGLDYSFAYRITRLRNVQVVLRSLLDDAMRTIGARTELEATLLSVCGPCEPRALVRSGRTSREIEQASRVDQPH
jgi:hypothetical protein